MASASKIVSRGKTLQMTLELNIEGLLALMKNSVDLRAAYLSYLGNIARKALGRKLLSDKGPNTLNYKGLGQNKAGKYKINNRIIKGVNAITFTSPPANFFEWGRVYKAIKKTETHPGRPKRVEKGRFIITRQFKGMMESNLQSWSDRAAADTIEKEFAKV